MIKTSIYKPITMLMVILSVVVFGVYTYSMMAVNMIPDIEIPVVTASVVYKGASPEEIESTVIKPIEDQIELIDGIDYMQAYALENYAIFVVMFNMGVNVDVAASDVRDKIELVQVDFPDEVEDAVIQKVDINGSAIVELALTGPANQTELRTMADDIISPKISATKGVASVDLFGGTERQINVELNKEAMMARNVDISTVMGLITAANLNYPFGSLDGKTKNTTVRTSSKFTSMDEIRNTEIPTSTGVVRLSEVATIKDTIEEVSSYARFNGTNSIGLSVKKRTDANIVEVAQGVIKAVDKLNAGLPEGYKLNLVYDKSTSVSDAVNDVLTNILMAIILTAAVLLLFLGKFSTMFISAVTMPISVIGAFIFMYAMGFSINVMTLMALSSSVGILVTNSIIILENITMKLEQGLSPKEAAYEGTTEIMVAIMASTLTNVCVFVPIAFMQSMAGVMFRSFGLTMVAATAVSLLVSFTLTPLMAAYLFKARKRNEDGSFAEEKQNFIYRALSIFPKGMHIVRTWYLRSLQFCLSRVGVVVQVLALLGVLGITFIMATKFLSVEIMPNQDEGVIKISIELPGGSNVETTDAVTKTIEERVKGIPELQRYYASVGGSNGISTTNEATVKLTLIKLSEGRIRSTNQIIDSLRGVLSNIPDAYISIKSTEATEMGGSTEGDVTFEVTGVNGDSVVKAVEIAMDKIKDIPGVVELKSSYEAGTPELVFHPNRAALADYGMTIKGIATAGYIYVSGYDACTYTDQGEEYDLNVSLRENDRDTRQKIMDLPVLTPKGYVPISTLFSVEQRQGASQITRKDKKRLVQVTMNLLPGHTTGEIMGKITAMTKDFKGIPEGIEFGFGGNADMQNDMVNEFVVAIFMAILLTYILLVALLESFAQPFMIMTTIPMGAIGVIISLVLTGKSLSIIAFFAIVTLIGVVVNNAILLLDEANRLLRKGEMGRRSAVLTAAEGKFQPILLATVASIIAQIPLAMGSEGSSAMTQPMGIATIGGLAVSAILTMYLIPTFFWLPNALFTKVQKKTKNIDFKKISEKLPLKRHW